MMSPKIKFTEDFVREWRADHGPELDIRLGERLKRKRQESEECSVSYQTEM